MSLFRELRRRRVFRLAGLYLIGAWLVLQIADVLFAPLGLPAWSMSALVWIVLAGFFVAVVLSWRYDIGDDGLVRITASSDEESGASPLTTSDYAILGGGVVAAALLAWLAIGHIVDRSEPTTRSITTGNTVAVLPFRNRTGDDSLEYLGEGVAEEVTNHLSLLEGISVLAYTVSFGYDGPATDPRQVGRDLDVDYVVMGSIRNDGPLLRVSAQLIEADTRVQLWSVDSGTIDHLKAFEVQDAISTGIADAMVTRLGLDGVQLPSLSGEAPDPAAYDLYLKGRSIWFRRGAEDIGEAVNYLSEAVRLDPDFAAAWAALASAYVTWPSYSRAGVPTWGNARVAAEKALEIDPDLAEPHAVLSSFEEYERNWAAAGARLERALALDERNATSHYWYSEHLAKVGRYGDSIDHLVQAIELDPTYIAPRIDVLFVLLIYGKPDMAMVQFESMWSSGVRTHALWQAGFIASVMSGNVERAEELIRAVPLPDQDKETLVDFLGNEPGSVDANRLIARLADDPAARPDYRLLVWIAAWAGELDFAMDVYRAQIAVPGSIELRVLWGPGHRLPEHPDFVALLDELGLVDYWEQTRIGDLCGLEGGSLACEAAPAGLPDSALNTLLETVGMQSAASL